MVGIDPNIKNVFNYKGKLMAETTLKIENPRQTRPTTGAINKNFAPVADATPGSTLNWYDNGVYGGLYTTEVLAKSSSKTESIDTLEDALVHMQEFILAGIVGTSGDVTVGLSDDKSTITTTIGGLSAKTEELFAIEAGGTYSFDMSTDLTDKFNVYTEGRKGELKMVMNDESGIEEEKLVKKVNGIVKQWYAEVIEAISRPAQITRNKGKSGILGDDGILDPKKNEYVATISRKLRTNASNVIWYEHTEIGTNPTSTNKHFRAVNEWKPEGHTTSKTVSKKNKETGVVEKSEVVVSDAGFVPQNLVNGVLVPKSVAGFDTSIVESRTTEEATVGLTSCVLEATKKNSSVAIEELTAVVSEEASLKFAAYAHLVEINVDEAAGNITVTFPTAFFRTGSPARLEKLYRNLDTEISVIVVDIPSSDTYRVEKGSNTAQSRVSRFQKFFKEEFKAMKAAYKIEEEAGRGVTLVNPPKSEEEVALAKAKREKKAAEKKAKAAEKVIAAATAAPAADDADEFEV